MIKSQLRIKCIIGNKIISKIRELGYFEFIERTFFYILSFCLFLNTPK